MGFWGDRSLSPKLYAHPPPPQKKKTHTHTQKQIMGSSLRLPNLDQGAGVASSKDKAFATFVPHPFDEASIWGTSYG